MKSYKVVVGIIGAVIGTAFMFPFFAKPKSRTHVSSVKMDRASNSSKNEVTVPQAFTDAQTKVIEGNILLQQSNFVVAETKARQAMALRPEYPSAYRLLIKSLIGQNRRSDALVVSRELYANHPTWGYVGSNFPKDILDYANLARGLGANQDQRYALRRILQTGKRIWNDVDPAIPNEDAPLARLRSNAEIVVGFSQLSQSEYGTGLAHFRNAVESDPDNPYARFYYGSRLRHIHRDADARLHLEAGIGRAGNNNSLRQSLERERESLQDQ